MGAPYDLEEFMDRCKVGLTFRERFILELYYGLRGLHPHTEERIAKFMGLSRARVGQIKRATINKILTNQ